MKNNSLLKHCNVLPFIHIQAHRARFKASVREVSSLGFLHSTYI
jgi:hypothetical protein